MTGSFLTLFSFSFPLHPVADDLVHELPVRAAAKPLHRLPHERGDRALASGCDEVATLRDDLVDDPLDLLAGCARGAESPRPRCPGSPRSPPPPRPPGAARGGGRRLSRGPAAVPRGGGVGTPRARAAGGPAPPRGHPGGGPAAAVPPRRRGAAPGPAPPPRGRTRQHPRRAMHSRW